MNIKRRLIPTHPLPVMALAILVPVTTHAQSAEKPLAGLPGGITTIALSTIGALLVVSIILIFKFRSGYKSTSMQLADITTELEHARQRFTETNQQLEKTESSLKKTTQRYQGILFDARIGMFQMDPEGKCTYINTALQKMSGLYPKKALNEGLQSAIHPDDKAQFDQAWQAFTKGNESFAVRFRFKQAKGPDVHVSCLANKVFNDQKKIESYIGWVSNVTDFHQAHLHEQAATSHYARFLEDAIEGYYHLAPETPIPLDDNADQMATAIMTGMKLVTCNENFAGLYGTSPSDLKGKEIKSLPKGCGPFKNTDAVKKLIEDEYKLIGFESIRQDPRGNRLNLLNNVIGIIEDNKLVGIWGCQRNISQLKREKEELISQAQFMHRILDTLPADVNVKDTRCRYLYASRKLAERTGISQENWIGKTIFEVMPATPRDHDKNAINVMKTGKLSRIERSFEARKKTGWMETVQIPLVSDEGLIEGVVGLSFDTTDRKMKEDETLKIRKQLEDQLQHRTSELQESQAEFGKTATELRKTSQELDVRKAELENQRNEFEKKLNERKRVEQLLQNNEETLITRQKQLEEQLASRIVELESKTDKRKKWEELITIKETELKKLEEFSSDRSKQLEEEIARRKQTESDLKASLDELEKNRSELEAMDEAHQQKLTALTDSHKKAFDSEHSAREAAESQLKKTTVALQGAQKRIQTLLEQHTVELEHEVAERKTASTKLIQNAEELDELKQKFNARIEEETKALKQELAKKQIHENALRQQGKDLDARIKDLEKTLQTKIQENNKQIEAREGAEVQRQQIEQKLEQMNTHQGQLIERETQKLNLNIAEIRLEEVKLRKAVSDLQQKKEALEALEKTRASELEKAVGEQQKLSTLLSEAEEKLESLKKDQDSLVARETKALQDDLQKLQHTERELHQQEELLIKQGKELEETIKKLSANLKNETKNREIVEKELQELQLEFDASQENISTLIKEQTTELSEQIKQHQKNEEALKKTENTLRKQADDLQKTIETRTLELAEAQKQREKAELELAQVIERSSQGSKEIEAKIAAIRKEHLVEIERVKDEHKDLRKKEKYYRTLFHDSAEAFLQIDLKSGAIELANSAAVQLFGEETTDAITGKTIGALSPKQQPENTPSDDMAKARLHSAIETGHESFEWQFLKADKETFHSLVSLSTIQIDENQVLLAVINDISTLKQQQADLQQAIEEAHAANRMSSKIVDELNETVQTSLTPVVTSAAVIEKAENLSEEQKVDMQVINRNCRTLIDTMNYRCELSHLTDGTDEVAPSKCDLHGLIKDLDQQFSQRAETKKLFFAISYAQYQSANNVPKFVETDEQKVRAVMGILLGYALAHTEKGRLGLHAARQSDKGDSISVAFELAYTGKEKEDSRLSNIFGSDHTEAEDMKYGLTLAQRYVRMLGGTIALEYRKSDVTALTINFPFKKVASEIVMPTKNAEVKKGAA